MPLVFFGPGKVNCGIPGSSVGYFVSARLGPLKNRLASRGEGVDRFEQATLSLQKL